MPQFYEQFYRLQASGAGCELRIWSVATDYNKKVEFLSDNCSFPLRRVLEELPFVYNGRLRDHHNLAPDSVFATVKKSRIERSQWATNVLFWPAFVENELQRLSGDIRVASRDRALEPSSGEEDETLYGMNPVLVSLPIED